MRRSTWGLLLAAVTAQAQPMLQPADAGARLSAIECELLLDTMIALAVTESLANDPAVKKMNAQVRELTAKAAKRQALADPKLAELKLGCPARYSSAQRDCILKAKTMTEVDACTPR